jgi:hypothetical protein
MLEEMKYISGNYCHIYSRNSNSASDTLSRESYFDILGDSVFLPSPMGNVNLDTWRLYEALEAAAIPILERRVLKDYFSSVLGRHPIPTFASWRHAARFVSDVRLKPEALDSLQADIQAWWTRKKESLRQEMAAFVAKGLEGEFRESLGRGWTFEVGVRRAIWQYSELVRHATLRTLWRRLYIILDRLRQGSPLVKHRGDETPS